MSMGPTPRLEADVARLVARRRRALWFRLEEAARALRIWRHLVRSRRHLRELTDDQLRDVGLTRAQAEAECAKPPWRV